MHIELDFQWAYVDCERFNSKLAGGPVIDPNLPYAGLCPCVLGGRLLKERQAVEATDRDEVKRLRLLKPLQSAGHVFIVILPRLDRKTRSSQ